MPLVQKLLDQVDGADQQQQQPARHVPEIPKQPERQKQPYEQAPQQEKLKQGETQAAKQEEPHTTQQSPAQAQVQASPELQEKPADGLCRNLSQPLLAKWAVNNTVMLVLSDWSTTPHFFHHWLGNIKAAGINYWLAAAKDKGTSKHYVDIGLYSRCMNYLSDKDPTDKSAGGRGTMPICLVQLL